MALELPKLARMYKEIVARCRIQDHDKIVTGDETRLLVVAYVDDLTFSDEPECTKWFEKALKNRIKVKAHKEAK